MTQINFNDKSPGDYLSANDINSLKSGINDNESLITNGTVSGVFDSSNQFRYNYHLIPKTNSSFDIGSAEYKVRHLYLSDNSLWIGDDNKIEASSGAVKTKKRNKNVLPFFITGTLNKTENEVLTTLGKASVSEVNLSELEQYVQGLDPTLSVENIYPREDSENYYSADFEHIFEQNDNIGRLASNFTNDGGPIPINILENNIINLNNDNQNQIILDIHGVKNENFAKAQITLYVVQSTSSANLIVNVNGQPSMLQGEAKTFRDGSHIITIDLLHYISEWKHFVTIK